MKLSDLLSVGALVVSGISIFFSYSVYSNEVEAKEVESRLFTEITREIKLDTITEEDLISRVKSRLEADKNSNLRDSYKIRKAVYSLMQKGILVFVSSGDNNLKIELSTSNPRS